jgi:hypothetical protein
VNARDGIVQKVFRICIHTFVRAHRIAPLSHRIFRTFFFAFLHFFDLFAASFTVNAPKTSKKCEKNVRKMRKSAKCECDAKMESKFASHRTTTEIFFFAFLHFFASHSHRTTIPGER